MCAYFQKPDSIPKNNKNYLHNSIIQSFNHSIIQSLKIAILGLGEAGSHFANDLVDLGIAVSGWDPDLKRKLNKKVHFAGSNSEAVRNADIVWSVNLTSESKNIAREVIPSLQRGQIYCEMNTSSPNTKKDIATILSPAGIQFVDLAIMAPVPANGILVPLLASGEGSQSLAQKLRPYNLNIEVLSNHTGDAARRKLLRSIVYKGVAAVVCEAMEAGKHFEMEDYIRNQMRTILGIDDPSIDVFVNGSHTHAERRSHEMEAVVEMLTDEGLSANSSNSALEKLKKYALRTKQDR